MDGSWRDPTPVSAICINMCMAESLLNVIAETMRARRGANRPCPERRQSKVHRAIEWPKPSSVRSNVTMSASARARMHRPSCTSSQLGLITTTRFTPTRHSDIVHPVSLSQLTEARDRVRSFGGYNKIVLRMKRTSLMI